MVLSTTRKEGCGNVLSIFNFYGINVIIGQLAFLHLEPLTSVKK